MTEEQIKREAMKTSVLVWAVGLIASILVAGIPWAFYISTNVARIDQKLSDLRVPPAWMEKKVDNLEEEVDYLNKEINRLKEKINNK